MIDINGDCFSDIVLLSGPNNNNIEFYTKNGLNTYDYSSLTLSKNISWMSFADFDSNGAPDIFLVIF